MTPYSILLFDADNTLFNFDAGNPLCIAQLSTLSNYASILVQEGCI